VATIEKDLSGVKEGALILAAIFATGVGMVSSFGWGLIAFVSMYLFLGWLVLKNND
jgi:hypothetical protein